MHELPTKHHVPSIMEREKKKKYAWLFNGSMHHKQENKTFICKVTKTC